MTIAISPKAESLQQLQPGERQEVGNKKINYSKSAIFRNQGNMNLSIFQKLAADIMHISNQVATSNIWFLLQLPVIFWGVLKGDKVFERDSVHQSKGILDVEHKSNSIICWPLSSLIDLEKNQKDIDCNENVVKLSLSNINTLEEKESFRPLRSKPRAVIALVPSGSARMGVSLKDQYFHISKDGLMLPVVSMISQRNQS